jgi:hypothetical protein
MIDNQVFFTITKNDRKASFFVVSFKNKQDGKASFLVVKFLKKT